MSATAISSLAADSVQQIFPMTFVLDREMTIRSPSPRLEKRMSEELAGQHFLEVFTVHRPHEVSDFDSVRAHLSSLFLLVSADGLLALRGQFIRQGATLCFAGTPWLSWMTEHSPGVELDFGDFPKVDTQLDQQFYITTQDAMVRDLEALNLELTELREIERRASQQRAEFFALMSHEMRTPLNGIVSALSLLRDSRRAADHDRLIQVVGESALQLMDVINYALDYSKIDAGAMQVQCEPFALAAVVDSVREVMEPQAEKKGIELVVRIDDDVPPRLQGDQGKLRQVLTNLTSNAVKYTSKGSVTIHVSKAGSGSETTTIRIAVSDTGAGIPGSQVERIFEPWWTRESAGSKEFATGLGLSICRHLVGIMDGSIEVDSTVGVGSCFTVTLPLQKASETDGRIRFVQEDVGDVAGFDGRVLLVDDNETNLMLGKMILEDLGLGVVTAREGTEAIVVAARESVDLVLMDISMPGMDGVEATRHIKALASPPPVIALTAHVGPDMDAFYRARGFEAYLGKPLETIDLARELGNWLGAVAQHTPEEPEEPEEQRFSPLERLVQQIGIERFEKARTLFASESERRLGALLSAWVERDLDRVARQAHALAGSFASFGCDDLCAVLRRIEAAGRSNNVTHVIADIKNIEAQVRDNLEWIKSFSPLAKENV